MTSGAAVSLRAWHEVRPSHTLVSNPETAPRASVIIVNYNGRAHLSKCLPPLVQDSRDYEIILLDNASSDGSAEYVARAFPAVRVIRNASNVGFGRGCNIGASQARGQFLAFLNPDTVIEPGWLNALINALETDPQAGLATSKILLLDTPDRINTCGNETHFTGLTLCRGMGMAKDALDEPTVVDAVSGAAFAVRKDLFESLGGFDESFFLYMEDTDLSWRARLAGHKCIYVPSSVVYHDYALCFGRNKIFYQERNRYLMLIKGLRWRTLLVLLPSLLAAEALTWGFTLLRARDNLADKLRALRWIVRNRRLVLASRERTQAQRSVQDRDLLRQCTYRLAFEQTGDGALVRLAHLVFDPLFLVLHKITLTLIWW